MGKDKSKEMAEWAELAVQHTTAEVRLGPATKQNLKEETKCRETVLEK